MPLPNPDKAREIVQSAEEFKKRQEASIRAQKKRERDLKNKAKKLVEELLPEALKIAYEGKSFLEIRLEDDAEIPPYFEEELNELGYEVYKVRKAIKEVDYKIQSITNLEFEPLLRKYESEVNKLKAHINSWLSVRFNREGTYASISSKVIPLIFNQIQITANENNWEMVFKTLNSWSAIKESDEPGTYLLGSLVLDDEGFHEVSSLADIALNTAREKALSDHAVFLKKIATLLRNIEQNSYGNLKKTLATLNSFKNNPMVISWVNPPKNIGTHGFITAWILAWIAQSGGKEFLDNFSNKVECLAKEGIKEMDLADSIELFEMAGFNTDDLISILTSLNFEIFKSRTDLVVRWA